MKLLLGVCDGSALVVGTAGWRSHNRVLAHLISLRGSELFATHNGRNLFSTMLRNLVKFVVQIPPSLLLFLARNVKNTRHGSSSSTKSASRPNTQCFLPTFTANTAPASAAALEDYLMQVNLM
jgi:hypothetical protein